MSALTLTLKDARGLRVDCSLLTPDKLAGKSLRDVAALSLQSGNRKLRVDELFALSGDDASDIVIENSSDKLDYLGARMERGTITINGNTGAYVGLGMKNGAITVKGNCGMFAAAELTGGMMEIAGNCADFVGGALVGNRTGMAGGTVIVRGNAGDRAGDHMRRGALLIEGNAGDFCGSRMVAGTIAVLGTVKESAGFAMQRGTLLLSSAPKNMLVTFNDCGSHNLGFLPLLIQSWRQIPGRFAKLEVRQRVRRYMGDLANLGQGEILIFQ